MSTRTPVALLLATLLACNGGAPPTEAPPPGALTIPADATVVVKVGDMEVTQEMVDTLTKGMPAAQMEQIKASGQFQGFLEQIGIGQALYAKALEEGLHKTPDAEIMLAMAQRDALAKMMVDKVAEAAVTDEKLQEAYEARKVQYADKQVRARHILVDDEAKATGLVAELQGGADFAELAKANSSDKGSAEKGGDLNWFKKGQMVPEFANAAFAATGDEIVGPIKTQYGYHIIQVTDRRETTPLEDVKDQLAQSVKQEAVGKFIEEVKASAGVTFPGDAPAADAPAAAPEGEAPPTTP